MQHPVFKSDQQDMATMRRVLSQLEATNRSPGNDDGPALRQNLGRIADRLIRERKKRSEFFEGIDHLLEDVGWDLLLHLYEAQVSHRRVTATSLASDIGAPATTAIRYLQSFSRAGLIDRQPDWQDRRRCFLALTPRGEGLMERYLLTVTW